MKPKNNPLERLKHHVSGAIERGEKTAVEAVVKPKHTPGPWMHTKRDSEDTVHTLLNETNPVAHVFSVYGTDREANARLIACAPELLEALQRLADAIDSGNVAEQSIGTPKTLADLCDDLWVHRDQMPARIKDYLAQSFNVAYFEAGTEEELKRLEKLWERITGERK